ncbi:MAG TPA: DUF2812 domain-containing protein [Thermotogota bacterium]|nr:DUF2812 domain-containing protein [Thermotogota bacterium]
MKRAIWRLYLNFEKEEKWLNEMATAGWMLTDYSWCRYVFEEGREGEYVYRIELLKNLPTYPLSQKYLRFLEEAGIEYVAYYARWVYLRKKTADGPFDLYTDLESKIAHYRRVLRYWHVFAGIEMTTGLSSCAPALNAWWRGGVLSYSLWMSVIPFAFGILFLFIAAPIKRQLKRWKKELQIRES